MRVYQVDKEDIQIDALFEGIEAAREELGIQDWGLSQTSLEEVFLTIVNSTAGGNQAGAVSNSGVLSMAEVQELSLLPNVANGKLLKWADKLIHEGICEATAPF